MLTEKMSREFLPQKLCWECKNPDCPDRSKSGRGKRFEEFGTYRYFKLVEDDPRNRIDSNLYKNWKRDIYFKDADPMEMIFKEYAWADEKIGLFNIQNPLECYGRNPITIKFTENVNDKNTVLTFENLPLVVLLNEINKLVKQTSANKVITKPLEIINANSTDFVNSLKTGLIGNAITSPPYYNAREYSQWQTLVLYLIDMMLNAKAIYQKIDQEGTYLYNIGDIVSEDNVYIKSNMSKKRLQLGFLSCLIFEIAGFKLTGNIIWDKGEVQSKRNSTVNLNTGFVKCINCYEHVLIFKNKLSQEKFDYVSKFSPVIKINCKGENTYKHTAPYPLEMIDLIKPFLIKEKYLLDPFLGSGTTLCWCKKHNQKLFVDGARLGYALATPSNDITLKDLARLTDAFYIGGTKCGALCGEALIYPNGFPSHILTRVKQHGALPAKSRLFGVTFDALLTDNLYVDICKNALDCADKIREELPKKGYKFFIDSPTNQIFIIMENTKLKELEDKVLLSFWEKYDDNNTVIRIATSWATTMEDVEKLLEIL